MLKSILSASVMALFIASSLAACERRGPAERAGERIDNAYEQTRDSVRNAAEEVRDRVEDACDSAVDGDC